MNKLRISVIVTTYNRPKALKYVLEGLSRQTILPIDVVVVDDGSTHETSKMIEEFTPSAPYELKYVWQQDKGFRAAMARNKGAAISSGDYLVFLDGDCIPCKNFLYHHGRFQAGKTFVTGNRILISKAYTQQLEERENKLCQMKLLGLISHRLQGHFNRLSPLLPLPDGKWRNRTVRNKWQGAKTCNLAVAKKDFLKINGFDENYEGWGHEDADLTVRLMAAGIQRKDGRWGAAVFHLWHEENNRANEQQNKQRLLKVIKKAKQNTYVSRGVSAYID